MALSTSPISLFSVCLTLYGIVLLGACCLAFDPYQNQPGITQGAHLITVEDVVFVIRSQASSPHVERARFIRDDLIQQSRILKLSQPDVLLLHEHYGSPTSGQWAILQILPRLYEEYETKKWFFFCEEDTRVSIQGVLKLLSRFSSEEEWFWGKALIDQEPTIIHHFRFANMLTEFIYPDFDSGWVLSHTLIKSLVSRISEKAPDIQFSIDVKHEVAHYIWNEEGGLHMTGLPQMCAGNLGPEQMKPLSDAEIARRIEANETKPTKSICVTGSPRALPQCGKPVSENDIFFAVKTCEQYHSERVPVVQQTWGRFAAHMVYFSDKADSSIPTVDSGVPNTKSGHCGKTLAILNQFLNKDEYKKHPWLAIVDDDTIISVSRLRRLLTCYDVSTPVFLGERYGFGHPGGHGYDYITGGGGMIFSREAVKQLLADGCRCSKDSDPDDMILGMCAKRSGLALSHSPLFHQARPTDYAKGYLAHQTPVSFHKHWNINPHQVYDDWFRKDDEDMRDSSHDEL